MWTIRLIVFVAITLFGCDNNGQKKALISEKKNTVESVNKNTLHKKSFTVSCGSGCAMTYNEVSSKKEKAIHFFEFKVTMYVNEEVAEEYREVYEITCDGSEPASVRLKGEKEDLLKSQESLIRPDLEKIAKSICSKN